CPAASRASGCSSPPPTSPRTSRVRSLPSARSGAGWASSAPNAQVAVAAPPGPPGLPLVGSLFRMRRDPLGFFTRVSEEYGDCVRFRVGRGNVVTFFRHPDQIKDVLVTHQHAFMKGRGLQWAKVFLGEGLLTSEGEFHTRQRRLSQPAFHRQRIL